MIIDPGTQHKSLISTLNILLVTGFCDPQGIYVKLYSILTGASGSPDILNLEQLDGGWVVVVEVVVVVVLVVVVVDVLGTISTGQSGHKLHSISKTLRDTWVIISSAFISELG